MQHRQIEIDLVELDNKLLIFNLEDVDDGNSLKHIDAMLKKRGSKHIAIIAIPDNSTLETLDKDTAKRLLAYIIEQEEKRV